MATKTKLDGLQKRIRDRYTKCDEMHNVWLIIGHQSFVLDNLGPEDTERETKQHAEWRRDMLAIALTNMLMTEVTGSKL